jgi:hypothetical protein
MSNPTSATISATTKQAVIRRHPIRGILWGIVMGIGLTVVLVVTKVIELDLTMMILVTAIAIVAGVLWSTLAPAKAPEGVPPTTVTVTGVPVPTRFDDFDPPPATEDDYHRSPLAVGGESDATNDDDSDDGDGDD